MSRLGPDVSVALEATGHYWLALYDGLSRPGYGSARSPAALLDDLNIKGENYRLKEKRRAGLLGRTNDTPEESLAETPR